MSAIGGKADIRCPLSQWKTLSAKGPKFSARIWKNISIRMHDSRATGEMQRLRANIAELEVIANEGS